MVWKTQKSWDIGLEEFGVRGIQKCKKISADKFCLHFWATIMDIWIALKYQILFFLISNLQEFQPVKY